MNGASAALIKNELGEILIVKPTYRPEWLLPGGAIERDESTIEACKRECLEELGLNINIGELLCFEYRKANSGGVETTRFIFRGGIITNVATINLPPKELERFAFVEAEVAGAKVDLATSARLRFIESGSGVYFER